MAAHADLDPGRDRGACCVASLGFVFEWQKRSAPQRPSVAVLPFANLSGDPSQDYFADGVTQAVITDLAKLSELDVIARNSVSAYKGRPVVLAEVARNLGVRYVVEGSVQRAGEQIRIDAQLIDTTTGDHLWADHFDRGAADVFAVQDEMSRDIVKSLGMKPTAPEKQRMARPPTANLEAYDYYLRGEQAARTGRPAAPARGAGFLCAKRLLSIRPSPRLTRPTPAPPSTFGATTMTMCCRALRRANAPMRAPGGRCN